MRATYSLMRRKHIKQLFSNADQEAVESFSYLIKTTIISNVASHNGNYKNSTLLTNILFTYNIQSLSYIFFTYK